MSADNGLLAFAADVDPAREDDFNRWYEEEHLAERLRIPGFLKASRYRAVVGTPKYLTTYEVTDPAVFSSAEYLHFLRGAGETPWTRRILSACTDKSRVTYRKISDRRNEGTTQPGALLFVILDTAPEHELELNRWYEEEHIGERLSVRGFIRARRYEAIEGGPKYLAYYEVESTDVFSTPEYLSFYSGARETPWTRRVIGRAYNYKRNIYTKISERVAGLG